MSGPTSEPDTIVADTGGTVAPQSVAMGAGSAVTLAGQLLALAAAFGTSIITARFLGTAGKGELALLVQLPLLIATLSSLGLQTAATYYIGRGLRTPAEACSDALAVVAVVSLVSVPATVVAAMLTPGLAGVDATAIGIAASMVPLALAALVLTGVVTGLGRVGTLAARQATGALSGLVMLGTLAALGRLSVETAIAASAATTVITVALLFGAARSRAGTLLTRPSLRRVRETARYALKAHVAGLASQLDKRQDIIVLGILSTPSSVGIYSVGVVFAELLWQIPRAIATPLLVRSLRDGTDASATAATAARVGLAAMLVGFAGIAVVIGPVIRFAYTPAFQTAVWAFALISPGIIIYGVGSVLAGYMTAHGHLFPRLALTVATLNLVGNVLLIGPLDFYGAALASTISYSVGGVYLVRRFLALTGLPAAQVCLPRVSDLHIIRASVAAMLGRVRGGDAR